MTTTLPVLDQQAAFVDVGSEQMHVSIAGGQPEVFGTVTTELRRLRDWLQERQVKSVAMEATGVYGLPLYGVLEAAGFKVSMVNGKQTRNLPGRKTDMKDCQWGPRCTRMACCRRVLCRPRRFADCRTTCGCGPII